MAGSNVEARHTVMHHLPLVCVAAAGWKDHTREELGTHTEQPPWRGFGFYLQVGGAARAARGEVDLSERVRGRGRKTQREQTTGCVREREATAGATQAAPLYITQRKILVWLGPPSAFFARGKI